jgi:hypothetical protein
MAGKPLDLTQKQAFNFLESLITEHKKYKRDRDKYLRLHVTETIKNKALEKQIQDIRAENGKLLQNEQEHGLEARKYSNVITRLEEENKILKGQIEEFKQREGEFISALKTDIFKATENILNEPMETASDATILPVGASFPPTPLDLSIADKLDIEKLFPEFKGSSSSQTPTAHELDELFGQIHGPSTPQRTTEFAGTTPKAPSKPDDSQLFENSSVLYHFTDTTYRKLPVNLKLLDRTKDKQYYYKPRLLALYNDELKRLLQNRNAKMNSIRRLPKHELENELRDWNQEILPRLSYSLQNILCVLDTGRPLAPI